MMKNGDAVPKKEHQKFTAALSSVLSADPAEIRDRAAQAKGEKPFPHARWTFDPAKAPV